LKEFREICESLAEPSKNWNPAELNYLADLPHVIAHWHADPKYLDSAGKPAALPMRARGRSLATLIAEVLPDESPDAVVSSLVRLRGIRRDGSLYSPTGRQLVLSGQQASVHGLMALLGILRTIEYNVTRAPGKATLFERAAVNPRFPVSALPAFHRRFETMASDFLWSADGNMRRDELRRAPEKTTRLAVGVFVFEDPLITGIRARGKRTSNRAGKAERAKPARTGRRN
jgi:hypothetical protein